VTKRLIFNADDFGLTPGITRGILEAHHKGVVTSTTALVGSPHAADAIRQAIESAPDLGLGLHLAISGTGRPVLPSSEVPSLVREDGRFHGFTGWVYLFEQFNPDEIARELNAQCERFIDFAGRPPDHLDGHHHAVYRHPAGLRTLLDLAARYNIPIRNAYPDLPGDDSIRRLLEEVPANDREAALSAIKAILAEGPLPVRPALFDDSFYGPTATLGDLLLILTNLPEDSTAEIMCHPGYVDDQLDSDYTTTREGEIRILTHSSVKEVIKAEGIELITFAMLRG
jgi:chitin disaccharide deacetylase